MSKQNDPTVQTIEDASPEEEETARIIICSTPARHVRDTEEPFKADAWCFTCRARRNFVWAVYRVPGDTIRAIARSDNPWGLVYCEPYGRVECSECRTKDADLFPGWSREYED